MLNDDLINRHCVLIPCNVRVWRLQRSFWRYMVPIHSVWDWRSLKVISIVKQCCITVCVNILVATIAETLFANEIKIDDSFTVTSSFSTN